MSNYGQKTNQECENTNSVLFKRALFDAADSEICKLEEETENMEITPSSKQHKRRMNRLFRERVGGVFLPFPEVDNLYERVRSKLVIKLKMNEFFDRRKKHKRAR